MNRRLPQMLLLALGLATGPAGMVRAQVTLRGSEAPLAGAVKNVDAQGVTISTGAAAKASGRLTIEVDGQSHTLEPGDAIAYSSDRPHRIANTGEERAVAVWVNLDDS